LLGLAAFEGREEVVSPGRLAVGGAGAVVGTSSAFLRSVGH
jgi:hypothetical protein